MSKYYEPWVDKPTSTHKINDMGDCYQITITRLPAGHGTHPHGEDAYIRIPITGKPQPLENILNRIRDCVNWLKDVDNSQLLDSHMRGDIQKLFLAWMQQPEEFTPLLLLVDEIKGRFGEPDISHTYNRSQLIVLIARMYHKLVRHATRFEGHEVLLSTCRKVMGIHCEACGGYGYSGTDYKKQGEETHIKFRKCAKCQATGIDSNKVLKVDVPANRQQTIEDETGETDNE